MKLYFFGNCFSDDENQVSRGIISIMMPDLGVVYRTQFEGTQIQCQYTAAIMAIKFIENNQDIFGKQKIEMLTDAARLVQEVRGVYAPHDQEKIYRDTVLLYTRKMNIGLHWIPRSENRAAQMIPDLPPLKSKLNLNFDFGQKGRDSVLLQGMDDKGAKRAS